MLELPRFRLAGVCAHPTHMRTRTTSAATSTGGSAASRPCSTSWPRSAWTCRSASSPARPSSSTIPTPISTPSTPAACSTASPSRATALTPRPLRPVLRALKSRLIEVKDIQPRERFAAQRRSRCPRHALRRRPLGDADGLGQIHAGGCSSTGVGGGARLAEPGAHPDRSGPRARGAGRRRGGRDRPAGRRGDHARRGGGRQHLSEHQLAPLVGPRVERVGLSA